jgi:hypothetical protein
MIYLMRPCPLDAADEARYQRRAAKFPEEGGDGRLHPKAPFGAGGTD